MAYRKSTESSESFGMDGTMRLPGLGRDLLSEPNLSNPEASRDISTSLSRTNSARTTNSWDNRISHISSASVGGTAQSSTLPVSSPQDLQPSQEEIDSITEQRSPSRITMSPAQGRMSAERPGSPTKGLGGFVQSAMLKRSDSVNKRWKIDAPPGLTRADSIASSRSAASTAKMPRSPQRESRFVDLDQHSLPSPSSRPNSSHEQDITAQGMNVDRDTKGDDRNMIGEESTAVSSSKTMDSKRWSPTKASWLESALSRPDSPTKNLSSPHQHQSGRSASKLEARDSNSIGAEGQRDDTRETSDAKLLAYEIHDTDQVVREYHGEIDASLALPRASSAKNKTSSLISETPSDLVGQLEKKDEVGPDIEAPLRRTLPQQTQRPLGSRFEERNATASLAGSKPDTPPKPNFRANLKPKDVSDSKSSNGELEFRNVFGKLKRTETKNYVAPDELKNNILRGKAGLNVTGGPRKTQRVDEFKESILKQKAAMKEGGGSMIKRTPDSTAATTGKPSPNLPEAFSKRQQMSRSSSAQSDQAVKDVSVDKFSLGKEASLSSVSQPGNKVQETGSIDTRKPSMTKRFSDPSRKNETKPSGSVKVSDSETLTVPNRRLVNYQDSARSEPRLTSSSAHSQTSKPGDTSKAGSLAERLNPALAGLISRRPGQPASLTNMIAQSEESVMPGNNQVEHVVDATQGPSLTHTTKGRARGPKRRLPNAGKWSKAATLDGKDEKEALDNSIGEPESSPTQSKPNTTQFCPPSTSAALIKESSGAREASGTESRNTVSTPNMPEPKLPPSSPRESAHRVKSKPVVAPKSPVLRKVSSPKRSQYLGSDEVINARVERAIGLKVSEDPTKKTGAPRASKSQPSPGPPHPNSPSEASLPSSGRTKERGSSSPKSEALEQPDTKVRDWKAETKAIQQLLTKLFAQVPSLNITGSFDADKILHSQATQGQSTAQTILSQVSQLDPSGKATPLPAYKEHILFEDGIYICVYVYHPPHQPLEKHSEVFLWVGDQVPEAASEDAQLFGRKTAREYSTKLQVLRQGKESPNFLQAIAGVLLVRRSRSDEQYMLSARAHMKHLAFDEVEFDAQNLCSGFPYLIKSKTGKQYLWKGRGSTADELGIARLIGMDLGLTGEPSEIDEGTEPEQFFASFPTTHRRNDPDSWTAHWALKPKVPRYCTYLYRVSVDPGRPTSNLSSLWGRRGSSPPKNRTFTTNIVEIHPFAQCDLEPGQIYILDAYFEIFVYVLRPSISPQSLIFPCETRY